jgi:hypothetical protein
MPFLARLLPLLLCAARVFADSGGPYEAVPDLRPSEVPPVFAIPRESQPLSFYLGHVPALRWNKQLQEPDSYTWQPATEYHASVCALDHVGGSLILCVRYISKKRIAKGHAFADALLLLARASDSPQCAPIYFTTGGVVYDHTAKSSPVERAGAIEVTRHYKGSGHHRALIYIRGGPNGFERFTPTPK